MATNRKHSELVSLEICRLILSNVREQPEIARILAEYPDADIVKGERLYEKALAAMKVKKDEKKDRYTALNAFRKKLETLQALYRVHRKKAKVAFSNNESALMLLSLTGRQPVRYLERIAGIKDFYKGLAENEAFRQRILRLKVTEKELHEGLNLVSEIESLRAAYFLENAEFRNATEQKNAALMEAEAWMRDFFKMAGIALMEHPHLQEAFGKSFKK